MYLLKLVCLTFYQLLKQVAALPRSAATGFRRWRRQATLNQSETERLDRIRHPAKYLGR
jgi:hypothetical protein